MTTSPTITSGGDSEGRRALVRTLTNQMNQDEWHFRQTMASQEALDRKQTEYAQRSDQGHHSICSMVDQVSDQIAWLDICSAIYSACRIARLMIVRVGFSAAPVVN